MVADILPKWAGRACVEANEGCLTWRSPCLVEIPQPVQSQSTTPFSSKKTEPKHAVAVICDEIAFWFNEETSQNPYSESPSPLIL
jgi:hypothetical protein